VSKIKEVTRFQTTDNRLFETLGEAKKHQDLKDEVDGIINLLGGTNNDISPNSTAFSNGEGYYIISDEDFQLARDAINYLMKKLEIPDDCIIESRFCYDHYYLGNISAMLLCIFGKDGQFIRVGQPYFVQNFDKVTQHIFNK